jgi:hypothetical protein
MRALGTYNDKQLLGNESIIKDITIEAYNALSASDLLALQTIHITTKLEADADWGDNTDEQKDG